MHAQVLTPVSLTEAYELLAEYGSSARVLAGGTDLMVLVNARTLPVPNDCMIDVWNLRELRGVADHGDSLKLGALTTWSEVISSPIATEFAPALVAAARTIGAIQIQNRGTVGGNVVNASPAGDSLPVFAAFDAEIEIGSARGVRRVGFNEFYLGYRKSVLRSDEILLAVYLPKLRPGEHSFFYKVGTRRAQAISKVVLSVRSTVVNGAVDSIGIGVGSVAATVIRARQTEGLLKGKRLTPELVEQARTEIAREISAISDLRSTEHYRRTVTGNLIARILKTLTDASRV